MRLKIALLCALIVGFGNVRAGVVGISPTSFTPVDAASTQGFTFRTTGLGGIKLSGIGLWSASISAASNNPLTLTLSQSSGTGTASFARTFTVAASTANTGLELAFNSDITRNSSFGIINGNTSGSARSCSTCNGSDRSGRCGSSFHGVSRSGWRSCF